MTHIHAWRWTAAAAVLGASVLALAPPASAHVKVDDGSVPGKGGYGAVRLSVPTESKNAATIGLTVTLPADIALKSARTLPIPGWTATVESDNGGARVSRIVWRATDEKAGGLSPTEFGLFTFTGGPWPTDRDTVPLPAIQSYSDGSTVAWDEIVLDSHTQAKHPAPVVTLGEAVATDAHGAHVDGGDAGTATEDGRVELAYRVVTALSLVIASGAAALAWSNRRRETESAGGEQE